jgi:hypothetical protein
MELSGIGSTGIYASDSYQVKGPQAKEAGGRTQIITFDNMQIRVLASQSSDVEDLFLLAHDTRIRWVVGDINLTAGTRVRQLVDHSSQWNRFQLFIESPQGEITFRNIRFTEIRLTRYDDIDGGNPTRNLIGILAERTTIEGRQFNAGDTIRFNQSGQLISNQ